MCHMGQVQIKRLLRLIQKMLKKHLRDIDFLLFLVSHMLMQESRACCRDARHCFTCVGILRVTCINRKK